MTDFYLTNKHLERINELEAEVASKCVTEKHYDDLTEKFLALEREYNEAISSCQIWQKEAEHAKSYKKVMKEQHKQLTEKLASVVKQNAKLLTMLQENGLA